METDIESATNQANLNMDDITKSFQREAEALREIVRSRDLQIKALKAHTLCLRSNFKIVLEAILDRIVDNDVQYHARKMIEQIDEAEKSIEKIERGLA